MTAQGHEAAEGLRRQALKLLLPGLPVDELARLRDRLGDDLPETEPDSEPEPEPEPDSASGSAPGTAGGDRADAVRAALGAARPSGLGPLVAAAREAGALDDALALDLLERARPARSLAALLGDAAGPGSLPAARLRALADRHLGADPARWRGLHDALAAHRGTLPELVAAAPVPATGPVPLPPKTVPATLGLLLEHAAPEHTAAALGHLPDTALRELLSVGSLPGPGLSSAVAASGDRRSRVALAGHARLDARLLKRLVAADDPTVNAAVYRNPRCTPSLRRAIADRSHTVPLDPGLRAELLAPVRVDGTGRTRLTPLLGCGDPELVAHALGIGVRKVAQRYALLRVWECWGPDAVRAMLADSATAGHLHSSVVADVTAALGEPDGAAGLRARAEPYEDPAELPRLLGSTRGTSTLHDLLNEPYVHDFPALAAANRRSPFMPKAAEELVRHEDATDADRADFRLTLLNEPWRAGGRRGGNLTPPARRLATEPLDLSAEVWALGMVRAGLLDPAGLVAHARPAARAVNVLATVDWECGLTAGARADLRSAVHKHLSGHPEAWAVLLQLLPGFTGTLPELIAVAAQVAGPRPATTPGPA